jgi:hypothetical protein
VAAALAWARARDAALRGLVHALSNRVGTVGAVGAMLDGAAAESVGTASRILAGEGERLEALLALFRLATADPFGADAAPEPLHVPELLGEVAALVGYAAADAAVRVEAPPEVRPAVASRAALAQALVAAAAACGGAEVVLAAAPAGAAVRLSVGPAGGAAAADAAGAAAWLLAASGGSAAGGDGGVVVTVPALGGR